VAVIGEATSSGGHASGGEEGRCGGSLKTTPLRCAGPLALGGHEGEPSAPPGARVAKKWRCDRGGEGR
jgi:hypothetical protein